MKKFAVLACSALFLFGGSAHAWDGVVTGLVNYYDVVALPSGGHNLDFRVYLKGVDSFCTGAPVAGWAYVNSDDSNYKVIVSAVMMAYASGKRLIIYSNRSPVSSWCQIGYIQVADPV